jgi:hypothetical protein
MPVREDTELSESNWAKLFSLLEPMPNGCLIWYGGISKKGRSPVWRFKNGRALNVRSILWRKRLTKGPEDPDAWPLFAASCRNNLCVAVEHAHFVRMVPKRV